MEHYYSRPGITIYHGGCLEVMRTLPDGGIDLVVTSPPYDDIRTYDNGCTFDFPAVASQLIRILKPGGVIVWIVNDKSVDGSESGTSFRQALHFKQLGFRLHDTMIWNKGAFGSVGDCCVRYAPVFDYMFVFSKGKPKTFNPLRDRPNKTKGRRLRGSTIRRADGTCGPIRKASQGRVTQEFGIRFNVWNIHNEKNNKTGHPAVFPLSLAMDHIRSWSNPGDLVFDPFLGSGTTAAASMMLGRLCLGADISEKYCEIATKRLSAEIG
jgi:site-specific DNA-methyltransferase (adenine-specific)